MVQVTAQAYVNRPDPDWLGGAVHHLQQLAGHTLLDDLDGVQLAVVNAAHDLPRPTTPVEHLLLRGLLLEAAQRIGSSLHAYVHAKPDASCGLDEGHILRAFFPGSRDDPRQTFEEWATSFCGALRHAHPVSNSQRVAQAIRDNYKRTLNARDLARSVHMTSSGLRRAFRTELGLSLREYHMAVRLLAALPDIASEKIACVALDVGYRSTKNFYRAFRHLTGLTPTRFRRLSPAERQTVFDSAWKVVHRRQSFGPEDEKGAPSSHRSSRSSRR